MTTTRKGPMYDCPVCLEPLEPDANGTIAAVGFTKDRPENWVWGPYPVHDEPCQARIADPAFSNRVGTDGYEKTTIRLTAQAPETRQLLDHWAQIMDSSYVVRYSVKFWSDTISGTDEPDGKEMTPWPEMDEALNLASAHFSCLGTRSRSREAQAGYDIAVHNAARGRRVAMFAPDLTPRNPVPNLTIDRARPLTTEHIEYVLRDMAERGERASLVVVDRLQMMSRHGEDGPFRVASPDDIDEASRELKSIAMTESLGTPSVLLIARLERPRREGRPLDLDDLGAAAELEYHADLLTLVDRTGPAVVDVLVAKDRSGPAPRRFTASW
ncbi:DnaB-like helicase C-terminal domain-containing protein [Streptomyces sp. NPDC048161]|uniref:DnaB-like helicase C-terminal domain-containing protein n=1 Tax=Streptomyces sp. NPDC048161 TaxID=3160985 RepID=UPI0033EA0F1B